MKKQTLFLALSLLLMMALVAGCARLEARERGNDETPETPEPVKEEVTEEKTTVLKDSGCYGGLVETDYVQIKISGVPEEIPPRLFQVSEKAREQLSILKEGDEIIFVFLPVGETPPLLLDVQKL